MNQSISTFPKSYADRTGGPAKSGMKSGNAWPTRPEYWKLTIFLIESLKTCRVGSGNAWLSSVHQTALTPYEGRDVRLGIRAEHIREQPIGLPQRNYFADTTTLIDTVEHMGSEILAYFTTDGCRFVAKLSGDASVTFGQPIALFGEIDKLHFFDSQTEQDIR